MDPIGSAVLTFIGFKQTDAQTDKQTDKPNLYIDICRLKTALAMYYFKLDHFLKKMIHSQGYSLTISDCFNLAGPPEFFAYLHFLIKLILIQNTKSFI